MGDIVSVYFDPKLSYPKPPFNPPKKYPEFSPHGVDESNGVYAGVRDSLRLLGLDEKNYGKKNWNPLKEFISKGDTILLKPNFVLDLPQHAITHASVMRPLIDYALKALGGSGDIVVADAPLQSADFDKIAETSGLRELVEYYGIQGLEIAVVDLRRERALVNEDGVITGKIRLDGDPKGYVAVDLACDSFLSAISEHFDRYRVTEYDRQTMTEHHNRLKNEYLVSKTVLGSDVIINAAKLKTHKKAGITCALKNMVGINGDKSWLPHHRAGAPSEGGDEYPVAGFLKRIESLSIDYLRSHPSLWCNARKAYRTLRSPPDAGSKSCATTYDTREGSWFGNDTIWRTVLDLNTILFYADGDGILHEDSQRKYFCVVDGVLAGEGDGPIRSTPKKAGVLVSGTNPLQIDYACAKIMGFNPEKIPSIKNAGSRKKYPLTGSSEKPEIRLNTGELPSLDFAPAAGWAGHLNDK